MNTSNIAVLVASSLLPFMPGDSCNVFMKGCKTHYSNALYFTLMVYKKFNKYDKDLYLKKMLQLLMITSFAPRANNEEPDFQLVSLTRDINAFLNQQDTVGLKQNKVDVFTLHTYIWLLDKNSKHTERQQCNKQYIFLAIS